MASSLWRVSGEDPKEGESSVGVFGADVVQWFLGWLGSGPGTAPMLLTSLSRGSC